jgi:chemotaxis-related protein WspD
MQNCWKEIGVAGDHSCPELATITHCYNCKVYSELGQTLFNRAAPEGYLEEWRIRLAKPPLSQAQEQTLLVGVFRLGEELLGLPANILQVVLAPSAVHHIPHRSDRLLRGLVNVKGKLLLCAALEELLHLQFNAQEHQDRQQRMVVMARKEEIWAFEVNDFLGILRFTTEDQSNLPSLSSKTLEHFTQIILRWQDRDVNFLDANSIFDALRQHI